VADVKKGAIRRLRRTRPIGRALTRLVLPFTCDHGVKCRPRGWNVYWPCGRGCGVFEPERCWHRFGWWLTRGHYDPFGRSMPWRPF
jgi:hypothetical protein